MIYARFGGSGAYGRSGDFRLALTTMGLAGAVGVPSNVSVSPFDVDPLPGKESRGRGRPQSRLGVSPRFEADWR